MAEAKKTTKTKTKSNRTNDDVMKTNGVLIIAMRLPR